MPYVDREKQKAYMRDYQRKERALFKKLKNTHQLLADIKKKEQEGKEFLIDIKEKKKA